MQMGKAKESVPTLIQIHICVWEELPPMHVSHTNMQVEMQGQLLLIGDTTMYVLSWLVLPSRY